MSKLCVLKPTLCKRGVNFVFNFVSDNLNSEHHTDRNMSVFDTNEEDFFSPSSSMAVFEIPMSY